MKFSIQTFAKYIIKIFYIHSITTLSKIQRKFNLWALYWFNICCTLKNNLTLKVQISHSAPVQGPILKSKVGNLVANMWCTYCQSKEAVSSPLAEYTTAAHSGERGLVKTTPDNFNNASVDDDAFPLRSSHVKLHETKTNPSLDIKCTRNNHKGYGDSLWHS